MKKTTMVEKTIEQLNKPTSQGGEREYYAGKKIREVLDIQDLFLDDQTGRFSMMPRGLMASIALQLNPNEMKVLMIVLEETYSSGFIRWYFRSAKLARWAQFLDIENLKSRGDISNALKSLENAGILEFHPGHKNVGYVDIHRGTFLPENYEKVYAVRKTRSDKKATRVNGFSTQKALLALEGNTYANKTSLFDFSDENNSDVTDMTTQNVQHNRNNCQKRATKIGIDDQKRARIISQMPSTASKDGVLRGIRGSLEGDAAFKMLDSMIKDDALIDSKEEEKLTKEESFAVRFKVMVDELQRRSPYKSKVKWSTEGEKFFINIQDKDSVIEWYLEHQSREGKFAKKLEDFLMDYEAIISEYSEDDQKNRPPSARDRAV